MAPSIVSTVVIFDFILLATIHGQVKLDWLVDKLNYSSLKVFVFDFIDKDFNDAMTLVVFSMTKFYFLFTLL